MTSTTDPRLRSFIKTSPDSHFPIQNLPYGIFRTKSNPNPRVGVAIRDFVLDLAVLANHGYFKELNLPGKNIFNQRYLNSFMTTGRDVWLPVRERISQLLRANNPELRDNQDLRSKTLLPIKSVELLMPVEIGDYTDFYSSKEHATNVGIMFRGKENALMPNWLHLPVAYNGRSSSVILSGQDIHRPKGQILPAEGEEPIFAASRLMDFELEMGFFIGPGNELGKPVPIDRAFDHIFGMVLVNDWSARDIQKWEYQPLGPFLGKSFGTSISPWIVPMEALEPFRTRGPVQNPEPLSYLKIKGDWSFDIQLEVFLQGKKMQEPHRICRSNFKYLYWNICQQLAHHTVNGTNLRTGDLLASGTISGPEKSFFGSLLELTWRGTTPIKFPNGEERKFLQDGDAVTITGWCQGDGYRVGFGEVTGKILPSVDK
jgi:fumarylacetoacetase